MFWADMVINRFLASRLAQPMWGVSITLGAVRSGFVPSMGSLLTTTVDVQEDDTGRNILAAITEQQEVTAVETEEV